MKISQPAKNAVYIGLLCAISYLAVYIARNILSAVTPQMMEGGYTEEYIGQISSLYFGFYAVGQLVNGVIGDKIKAKWMISGGLLLSGISNFVFSRVTLYPYAAMLAYGMTGFFLSMIYGPMTKVVSENTDPLYTTRCSLGYTFASFVGTPMAGFLASVLVWQSVFTVGSTVLVAMAIVGFMLFTSFEKKGLIQYGKYKTEGGEKQAVKALFERQIVKFSVISIIVGIVRTSVVFWLPTYFAQYLSFTAQEATSIFTVVTFIISFTPFLSVFIYERLGSKMNKTILLMFITSSIFFTLTYFIRLSAINIVCIVVAIMASNAAATMLYSRYCPSLRDTGRVSSVTGFLDFLGYIAAAVANLVFGKAATSIGWGNLILVWLGLVVIGVVSALPLGAKKKE